LSDNEVKSQCQFIVCKQYTVLYKKCVIKEYDGTLCIKYFLEKTR